MKLSLEPHKSTWTPQLSEAELDRVFGYPTKRAPATPLPDRTPDPLAPLRPYLELQLAMLLVNHPEQALHVEPENIHNDQVAELVATLREYTASARNLAVHDLARALHGSKEFIDFTTWLYLTPAAIRETCSPISAVISALAYLDHAPERHAARVEASPKSWLKVVG